VSVYVHVEIDGETVINEAYETNTRERAATDLEDWADSVRNFEVAR
jgi:hypothetical protein